MIRTGYPSLAVVLGVSQVRDHTKGTMTRTSDNSTGNQLTRVEGIIPALESSHAVAYAMKLAADMDKDKIILVNLSGRGDKDMHTIAALEGLEV